MLVFTVSRATYNPHGSQRRTPKSVNTSLTQLKCIFKTEPRGGGGRGERGVRRK